MDDKIIDNGDGTKTMRWGAENQMSHTWKTPQHTYKANDCEELGTGWHEIGTVGVDSGRIVIIDPSYLRGPLPADEISNCSWDSGLKDTVAVGTLAVLMSSGFGDGVYPVEARVENTEMGLRIAEIRIKFF